ncbi:hypothetical protein [Deinococcus sp. UYEF24]
MKEVVKATGYGTRPFGITPGFRDELGDGMTVLAQLAEASGVSLNDCAALTADKTRFCLAEHGGRKRDGLSICFSFGSFLPAQPSI